MVLNFIVGLESTVSRENDGSKGLDKVLGEVEKNRDFRTESPTSGRFRK